MVRKVAILAPFRGANFGTVLQAFALSRFLCSHGIDGEYINYLIEVVKITDEEATLKFIKIDEKYTSHAIQIQAKGTYAGEEEMVSILSACLVYVIPVSC